MAAGTVSDTDTLIEFVIPLHSGNEFDKILEPGKSCNIIVAYHRTSNSLTAYTLWATPLPFGTLLHTLATSYFLTSNTHDPIGLYKSGNRL